MPLKPNRTRWDDALSRVDPTEFERLLAQHYRSKGWTVEHVGAAATGRTYDGGVDLRLRRGYEYVLVQCKRWNAYQVPHNDVHELVGIMVGEGATGAVLVTCGEFTRAALDAARRHPTLQMVDGVTVRRWIELPETKPDDAWGDALRSRAGGTRAPMRDQPRWIVPFVGVCALLVLALLFLVPKRPTRSVAAQVSTAPSAPVLAHTNVVPLREAESVSARASPPAESAPTIPGDAATPTPERAGRLRPLAQPGKAATTQFLREAGAPDPNRPIDHENARAAARAIAGVRSAFWIDRENFVVMVDGQSHRTMAMIDAVCVALQPLGDTLAVVVNVQDVTAQRPDDATTLSRNCQLPEGQSAMFRTKRQLDVVSPELRKQFQQQQAR